MTIIGNLPKAKGKGLRKVEVGSARGPAADVSVGAASTADFTISISPELESVDSLVVTGVSGLPANVLVSQIGFTATSITLRAVNPTTAAITISAGSLTVTYELIGS
jgi:hypothetical protein